MNPGDSKAMEGIQNVERANGGEMEHDSGDEAEETNGGVSLEEVVVVCSICYLVVCFCCFVFTRVQKCFYQHRGKVKATRQNFQTNQCYIFLETS